MEKLLVIAMLAACSHPADPRWPTREIQANDGGESLAPHMARSIAAAAVEEPKPVAPPPAAIPITPLVPEPTVTPAVAPPASDEPITTEQEIVIEIHEDD